MGTAHRALALFIYLHKIVCTILAYHKSIFKVKCIYEKDKCVCVSCFETAGKSWLFLCCVEATHIAQAKSSMIFSVPNIKWLPNLMIVQYEPHVKGRRLLLKIIFPDRNICP